jgi:hypothetical protein
MLFARRHGAAPRRWARITRTVAATGAVAAAAVTMLVAFAVPADAHTPRLSANCVNGEAVLNVNLSNYDAAKPNTVQAKDGGVVLVDTTFGGSYSSTWKRPGDLPHTFTVAVKAWDDPDGSRGWSFTRQLPTPACAAPPTTTSALIKLPPTTTMSATTSTSTKTTTAAAPVVATSPSGRAAAAPTSTPTTPLANTGSDVGPVLLLGAGLLGAGAVLLGNRRLAVRRARRSQR